MAELAVFDAQGQARSKLRAADSIFAAPVKPHVVRQAVNAQRANRRAGSASTKTRRWVSGGGKKPFKQKGTGRARQGTTRAPQMRGGAVVFGPLPRSWRQDLNRKVKRQALTSALSSLAQAGALHVVEDFGLTGPKTREMVALLGRLGLGDQKVLVLLAPDELRVNESANQRVSNVALSARNIRNVTLGSTEELNLFELVTHDHVVTTPGAIRRIEELLGEKTEEAQA
jgi:large subunit ribosomal protein L4